ncbi:MAG: Bro-N domain-containing protein [Bacteroidota bacterium]
MTKDITPSTDHNPILFEQKKIRRIWHQNEWFFSVVDIVEALTESPHPRKYWQKVKQRNFLDLQLSPVWGQLKLRSPNGKMYATDCVNTQNAFRLIQSIPSKKAEPFKRWLAQLGKERLDEIENPALAQERMKAIYEKKGYDKAWIDKRLRSIAIRQNLTDEWKARGIQDGKSFAILSAEISKATFGMTPGEYKKYKSLPERSKESLRDHMTDLELIFTMLGEKVTTEISQNEQPTHMKAHKKVAQRGGGVAGNARKETEKELRKSIVSQKNYLDKKETSPLTKNLD